MTGHPFRVGVVGVGAFGRLHASKIHASERAVLAGVFDIDDDRGRAVADRFGIRRHPDLTGLLDASEVVVVASPAVDHAATVEAALARGRHVYVEKPVACTASDARRIVATLRGSGLHVGVGHQERFVFAALGALDPKSRPRKIEARRIGPPTGRGEDVSVVFDLMVHDLDLVAEAFGDPKLLTITARPPFGADDEVEADLRFDCGREAHLIASRRAERRERVTRLTYDDGVLEIDFLSRTVRSDRPDFSPGRFEGDDPRLIDPLGYGLEAFFHQIRGDAGPRPVSAEDGARAVGLAEAVEAARTEIRRTA